MSNAALAITPAQAACAMSAERLYLCSPVNEATRPHIKSPLARGIWTTADADCETGMAELATQLSGLEWIEPDAWADEYYTGHWEWQGDDIGGHEAAWDHMVGVIDPEGEYTEHRMPEAPAAIRGLAVPERDDRTAEQVRAHAEDAAAEAEHHAIQMERFA